MGLFAALKREWFYTTELLRIQRRLKSIEAESPRLAPDMLEESVDAFAERAAFIGEDGQVSYAEFDAYANRVAHWAMERGLKAGDTVALYMGNRWEYVAIWYGLSKVGVITALLNSHITAHPLAHCLTVSETAHCIVEAELAETYLGACNLVNCDLTPWVLGETDTALPGGQDFGAALETAASDRPSREHRAHLRAKDACLKMFTSGTTGLPKAAIVAHTRTLYYLQVFGTAAKAAPEDRMLMVLPMYHATGGLCGVGAALSFGGALIIRRKFSASAFWPDAVRFGATMFMYVGELCRFLVAADPVPEETQHKIRVAIGNGLRPDVWPRFVERTGIPRIMEFYGATEGNVGLVNLDSKPGAIGRIPPHLRSRYNVKLVQFDPETETPVRNAEGRCIECGPNEVGEAIGEIKSDDARFRFDGYGDKEATEKKILRDVFEEGDVYFRTGDLLKQDELGYFYFVDRVGDTFRWKSENVSTNEVAEVLGVARGIVQANVYGVPVSDYSGKAGMAALIVDDTFDLDALHAHVHQELPAYARPLFLRIHREDPEEHTTGTFKLRKVDLVRQGFDPDQIDDPVYFDDPRAGAYVALTREIVEGINSGEIRV